MAERIKCDADCPQEAVVHALFKGDRELHFCGHHGNRFAVKLAEQAESVNDDRKQLVPMASPDTAAVPA